MKSLPSDLKKRGMATEEDISFFKNSLVPDESFFQTIIMNSKFSSTVQKSVHYIFWADNRVSPKDFTKNDLNDLKKLSRDYLIARKFADNTFYDEIDSWKKE